MDCSICLAKIEGSWPIGGTCAYYSWAPGPFFSVSGAPCLFCPLFRSLNGIEVVRSSLSSPFSCFHITFVKVQLMPDKKNSLNLVYKKLQTPLKPASSCVFWPWKQIGTQIYIRGAVPERWFKPFQHCMTEILGFHFLWPHPFTFDRENKLDFRPLNYSSFLTPRSMHKVPTSIIKTCMKCNNTTNVGLSHPVFLIFYIWPWNSMESLVFILNTLHGQKKNK